MAGNAVFGKFGNNGGSIQGQEMDQFWAFKGRFGKKLVNVRFLGGLRVLGRVIQFGKSLSKGGAHINHGILRGQQAEFASVGSMGFAVGALPAIGGHCGTEGDNFGWQLINP